MPVVALPFSNLDFWIASGWSPSAIPKIMPVGADTVVVASGVSAQNSGPNPDNSSSAIEWLCRRNADFESSRGLRKIEAKAKHLEHDHDGHSDALFVFAQIR